MFGVSDASDAIAMSFFLGLLTDCSVARRLNVMDEHRSHRRATHVLKLSVLTVDTLSVFEVSTEVAGPEGTQWTGTAHRIIDPLLVRATDDPVVADGVFDSLTAQPVG